MLNLEEIRSLRYYLVYGLVIVAFFTYSGIVGWKWFNPTSTEKTRSTGTHRGGHYFRYHK